MTKSEFIEKLALRLPQLNDKDRRVLVDTILNAIVKSLKKGHRVEIRGFGVFKLKYREARITRNPKTGASVSTPATCKPHFTPGKELKASLIQSINS